MSNLLNDWDSAYIRDLTVAQINSAVPKSVEQLRPKISIDGELWCVLYGENLQEGISGFGSTPREAMQNFENNLYSPVKSANQ